MMYHLNSMPNRVKSIPGKPKSRLPIKAKAAGKKVKIKYLKMVIKLLTMMKSPPSRTQTESLGCLSAKLFQSCLSFCISHLLKRLCVYHTTKKHLIKSKKQNKEKQTKKVVKRKQPTARIKKANKRLKM